MPGPSLNNFVEDYWTWNEHDKSPMAILRGENSRSVLFHPIKSFGTAGVRGNQRLNQGRYYWEINISKRVFGTSMMLGIGTDKVRLHSNNFENMLGKDGQGWGLSHKGFLWHNGQSRQYMKPFVQDEATTVGLLFDGIRGTLEYYKDGCELGVAFTDLHLVQDSLYPILCSTAAMSEMTLAIAKREFENLQDLCRAVILMKLRTSEDVSKLMLPEILQQYLAEKQVSMQEKHTGFEGKAKSSRKGRKTFKIFTGLSFG